MSTFAHFKLKFKYFRPETDKQNVKGMIVWMAERQMNYTPL